MTPTLTVINGEVRAWFKPVDFDFDKIYDSGHSILYAYKAYKEACEKAKDESMVVENLKYTDIPAPSWVGTDFNATFFIKEGEDLPLPEGIEWEKRWGTEWSDLPITQTEGRDPERIYRRILRLRPVEKKISVLIKDQFESPENQNRDNAIIGFKKVSPVEPKTDTLKKAKTVAEYQRVDPKTQESQEDRLNVLRLVQLFNAHSADLNTAADEVLKQFTVTRKA
jgi:hypothetical protein